MRNNTGNVYTHAGGRARRGRVRGTRAIAAALTFALVSELVPASAVGAALPEGIAAPVMAALGKVAWALVEGTVEDTNIRTGSDAGAQAGTETDSPTAVGTPAAESVAEATPPRDKIAADEGEGGASGGAADTAASAKVVAGAGKSASAANADGASAGKDADASGANANEAEGSNVTLTATSDGTDDVALRASDDKTVNDQNGLTDAITNAQAGDTITIATAGTYKLTNITVENVTITSNDKNDVIIDCEGSYGSNICSNAAGLTFSNVTMRFGYQLYHGFQSAQSITMKNCTLNGMFFSYGSMTFENCTFNAPGTEASGYTLSHGYNDNSGNAKTDYCMWIYGSGTDKEVKFTNCNFNGIGKFIHLYNEQGSGKKGAKVVAKNCTFNSENSISNVESAKAAFNVKETCGNSLLYYSLEVSDCTTEGTYWPVATDQYEQKTSETVVYNQLIMVDKRKHDTNTYGTDDGGEIVVRYASETGTPAILYSTPPKSAEKQQAYIGGNSDVTFTLANAVANAVDGDTITLLKDVDLGNGTLAIDKALTIKAAEGVTPTIKSSAVQAVLLTGSGNVTFDGVSITATTGHGIQAGTDSAAYSGTLAYKNGTLTVAKRGIRVYEEDTGFGIAVANATIQSNIADPATTYTTGDDSIGLSLSATDGKGYEVTIDDSTIKGFSYCITSVTSGSNLTVKMTGGATYGRAAANVWGSNNSITFKSVEMHGLNNQTGPTESFAVIVNYGGATNNAYTLDKCSVEASLNDAAQQTVGSTATEYLLALRGSNSTVNLTGGTSYTCNSPLRGGLEEYIEQGWTYGTRGTIYVDEKTHEQLKQYYENNPAYSKDPTQSGWTRVLTQGAVVAINGTLTSNGISPSGFFYSLKDALSKAKSGTNVYTVVYADRDKNDNGDIPTNENVNLLLNAYSVAGIVSVGTTGSLCVTDVEGSNASLGGVTTAGGDVTIDSGTTVGDVKVTGGNPTLTNSGNVTGDVTVTGGTLTIKTDPTVSDATSYFDGVLSTSGSGKIAAQGGLYKNPISAEMCANGYYPANNTNSATKNN